MPDLHLERENLAKAEQDIAEGDRRVAEQIILIEQMRKDGHDTTLAEEVFRRLEQALELWHVHRRLILEALARG